MDANRLKKVYEKHGIDEIIEIMLRKNDTIEGYKKQLEELSYAGKLYIGNKNYSVYLREEKQ